MWQEGEHEDREAQRGVKKESSRTLIWWPVDSQKKLDRDEGLKAVAGRSW